MKKNKLNESTFTVVNPRNGDLAFKYMEFVDNSSFNYIQRLNYFSLIWIKEGKGTIKVDFSDYEFDSNCTFAFSPYQPFMFPKKQSIKGIALHFHSDFFCILKHHKEVGCNGVLYNNIYSPPFVRLDDITSITFQTIFEQIKTEICNSDLAQFDLLILYLKILLTTSARLKIKQQPEGSVEVNEDKDTLIIYKLKELIEERFKYEHSPSDYAMMLNVTPKKLTKITKSHFNKTVSSLINERIIIEAKRELYLSDKTIKEIGYELGYEDEYYFSRFFKVNADVSPHLYRETVGYGKGSNS